VLLVKSSEAQSAGALKQRGGDGERPGKPYGYLETMAGRRWLLYRVYAKDGREAGARPINS